MTSQRSWRTFVADVLLRDISAALARTHGRITWSPGWSRNPDIDPAAAVTADGIAINMQLLRGALPTVADRDLRDRAAVSRRTTGHPVSAYVAVVRWVEDGCMDGSRRCGDLYDLWAPDNVGALNAESGVVRHPWTDEWSAPVMDVQACALGGGMAGSPRGADPTHGDRSRGFGGRAYCVGSSGCRGPR